MANIELLKRVRDHFEKFPQACNMDYFEITDTKSAKRQGSISAWDGKSFCVGGGAILLSGGQIPAKNPAQVVAIVVARLELSDKEVRDMLFFDHVEHDGRYNDLRDPLLRANVGSVEYAAVVIRVIDRCIASHQPVQRNPEDVVPAITVRVTMQPVALQSKRKTWKFWPSKAEDRETVSV